MIERHFDEELQELRKNLLKMASLVDEAVRGVLKSLKERDAELAEKIIEKDEEIDMLEIEIDRQCLELIAKRQPIAVDLRFLTSVMKINNDLERVGDLAIHVARRSISLAKFRPIKPLIDIPDMTEKAMKMLKDAMAALVERDSEKAREICERDADIDRIYVQNFREVLTYMMEDKENIKAGIHLILSAKQIERMADHITNIAEDIVYLVEGKTIKHHMEEKEGGCYE